MKSERDETLLSEKQLKHKVDHLKEIIASKSEELRALSERVHETMSSEVLSLQLELQALEQAKVCRKFSVVFNTKIVSGILCTCT